MLQPRIRTFSELPGWLAANRQRLAHKRVLMYCTGGVRCERASAYVRSLGDAFQDVHQLEGAFDRRLRQNHHSLLYMTCLDSQCFAVGEKHCRNRCGAPYDCGFVSVSGTSQTLLQAAS